MSRQPRRTVLLGLGSSLALATAGCLQDSDETTDDDDEDTDAPGYDVDDEFDSLFAFLPKIAETADMELLTLDADAHEQLDAGYSDPMLIGAENSPLEMDVSRGVRLQDESFEQVLDVYYGSIDFDGQPETRETEDGVSYERYEDLPAFFADEVASSQDDLVGAQLEDVAILASSASVLEAAFGAKRGDTPRLLEERPHLERGLEPHPTAATRFVVTGSAVGADLIGDPDAFEFASIGTTVLSDHEIEVRYVISVTDPDALTDELVDELTEELHWAATGEPTVDVEETTLTITYYNDLELQEKLAEINSPRTLRVEPFAPEDDLVAVTVQRGDQTPVEDLRLEIEGKPIDPAVWADGQATIGAGDTIHLPAAEIEPFTAVTLVHDHEYETRPFTSTVLNYLDVGTVTAGDEIRLVYQDDYPLDGDHLHVLVFERPRMHTPAEPVDVQTPWAGETVTEGDEVTIEGGKPGHAFSLRWRDPEDDDAELASTMTSPPGAVSFDYDRETDVLSATLEVEQPHESADFELQVDGEPADAQFDGGADDTEATAELTALEIGAEVTVVYVPAGAIVDGFIVPPPGTVEMEYDPRAAELALRFDLPEPQPASNYEVVRADGPAPTQPADLVDTVEDGDVVTIPDIPPNTHVELYWTDPEHRLTFYYTRPPEKAAFDYDHEAQELTVRLDLETDRDPEAYQLLLDDEPAPVQWADEYDTLTDGDELVLEEVAHGTAVEVRWLERELTVGGTSALPAIEYQVDFEYDSSEVTFQHTGGPALPVEDLDAQAFYDDQGKVTLSLATVQDGEFAEGDSVTVDFSAAEPVEDEGRAWDGAPDDMVLFDAWLAYLGEHRLPSQGIAEPDQSFVDDESAAVETEESPDD